MPSSFVFAWLILHTDSEASIVQRRKKFVWIFDEDVISIHWWPRKEAQTQKRTPPETVHVNVMVFPRTVWWTNNRNGNYFVQLPKHHNKEVKISLFCTWHLIGWIWKCWNLLFYSTIWLVLIARAAPVSVNALEINVKLKCSKILTKTYGHYHIESC